LVSFYDFVVVFFYTNLFYANVMKKMINTSKENADFKFVFGKRNMELS